MTWSCTTCTLHNEESDQLCAACKFPRRCFEIADNRAEGNAISLNLASRQECRFQARLAKQDHVLSDEALAKALQEEEDKRGSEMNSQCHLAHGTAQQQAADAQTVLRIQMNVPAQSLRGVTVAQIDAQMAQLHTPRYPGLLDIHKFCFRAMLEREQELHATHIVFYHSYSHAALLYEVQAVIAAALYADLPQIIAPLARLLRAPFSRRPKLANLINDFNRGAFSQQDHHAEFRELAISASMSLFGGATEAPPLQCFNQGYSCADLNFRGLLQKLLCSIGGYRDKHDLNLNSLIDVLIGIGDRFGLPVQMYRRVPRSMHVAGNKLYGHMLQIFVHRECVDNYAYASQPYGIPVPNVSSILAYASCSPVCGQARIFMDPNLFTDKQRACAFHYCAWPEFCSDEATAVGGGTQGAMRAELLTALNPLLESAASRKRAVAAIGLSQRL